jgi:hypothetical protein
LLSLFIFHSTAFAAQLFDKADDIENLQARIEKIGSAEKIEILDQNNILLSNPLVKNLAFEESKRLSFPIAAGDKRTVYYFCKSLGYSNGSVDDIKIETNPVKLMVVFARVEARSKYDFPFMWGSSVLTISKLKCSNNLDN